MTDLTNAKEYSDKMAEPLEDLEYATGAQDQVLEDWEIVRFAAATIPMVAVGNTVIPIRNKHGKAISIVHMFHI